jgi:hypothetical protein
MSKLDSWNSVREPASVNFANRFCGRFFKAKEGLTANGVACSKYYLQYISFIKKQH